MINQNSIMMQSISTPLNNPSPIALVAPYTFVMMNNQNSLFPNVFPTNAIPRVVNPSVMPHPVMFANPQIQHNQTVFSLNQQSSQENTNLINQQKQSNYQPLFYYCVSQNQNSSLLEQNQQQQQQQSFQQQQFQQYLNTTQYTNNYTRPNQTNQNYVHVNQQQQQHLPVFISNPPCTQMTLEQNQEIQEIIKYPQNDNNQNQSFNDNLKIKLENVKMKSLENTNLPKLKLSVNDKKRSSITSTVSTASCKTKTEGDFNWPTSDQSIQSQFISQELSKFNETNQNELLNAYEPHIQVILKQMYEQSEIKLNEQHIENRKNNNNTSSCLKSCDYKELQECFNSNKYLKWAVNTNRACSFANLSSQNLISNNKRYFNIIKLNKKIKKQQVGMKKLNNINTNNQQSVIQKENSTFNLQIENSIQQINNQDQNNIQNLIQEQKDSNFSIENQFIQSNELSNIQNSKITQITHHKEALQFYKGISIHEGEDSLNEQSQNNCQNKDFNQQIKIEENELKINTSKKTINSRFHNMNKLFMYKLLSQFYLENLETLGVPFNIREIFKKLISMVKKSSKLQKNNKSKQKTDFFSHDHYNLLFLTLNSQTIKYLVESQNNKDLHKTCFNFDISQVKLPLETQQNSQDLLEKIEYINVVKKYACEIILQSDLGEVSEQNVDDSASQEEITKQIYTKRALSGIQILNKGIIVRRF